MKAAMTSKERVRATIAHQEPDRVPVNYLYNTEIDLRLKKHYGLDGKDNEGLRRALGVDFRSVGAPYVGPKLHPDLPGRQIDIWGIRRRWIEHEAGGYWDYCDWPLREATLAQVEAWPLPDPKNFDYSAVVEQCEQFKDYWIVAGGAGTGDIINSNSMLRTMEQVLVDLATDEPAGLRLIDRRTEIMLEVTRRTLEAGAGRIDMLWLGEDLGTQIGPMIGLGLFRRHIRPRHQRFVDLAKQWGIPVMMHCCGSSSWAFDDFVEMGIQVVDTLQPEAQDMQPAYLKKRFGGKLAFHGMISTAGPLAYGSVQDVVETVRQTLAVMMPGGGYMLAPTHQIQSNSPTENVVAMYEAARRYGMY
jgi:uroporphyrinogen decarboxylase